MAKRKAKLSKFNIVVIFMLLFLFYIIWLSVSLVRKDKIFSYQVRTGSLAKTNIYEGLAIRDEEIMPSVASGYITYFAREGEHVGIGDYIYSIDQSGSINDMMSASTGGDNKLSNEDLEGLKNEVVNFCANYNDHEFSKTYDFLYTIDGVVLKYANANMLEQIQKVNGSTDFVKFGSASKTGYVAYSIDGFESTSVNGLTEEMFDRSKYEREMLVNSSLIDEGQTAYKIIDNDTWQIAIRLDRQRAEELQDEGYVTVRFLKDQRKLKGKIEVEQILDNYYGILTFNSSMPAYITDRYIDIEIISSELQGLKIPLSAIVRKEFYLIPIEYASEELEDNKRLFMRKTFLEDGTLSAEKVALSIYAEKDGYFYVNDAALEIGDYLLMGENFGQEYPVATKGELVGVYNMNLGYADFRQIKELYSNEEYAIIESNTSYGLKEYDFIVLDSSTVEEDDFIYE